MEFIRKILYGRKVYFEDKVIGKLNARIKNENPSIYYNWFGECNLIGREKDTEFDLIGNSQGPFKLQLKEVHDIINSLNFMEKQIESKINECPEGREKFKDWPSNFYLERVVAIDGKDNRFEVHFSPIDLNDFRNVYVIWKSGIIEIELELFNF